VETPNTGAEAVKLDLGSSSVLGSVALSEGMGLKFTIE